MIGRRALARLSEVVRGRALDRDLRDELDSHVAHLTDEYIRRGLDPRAARAAAIRDLGGVDQTAERIRDRRGWPSLELLVRDVRHALVSLRKSPAFTIVAVLTLALGIGANTAIFSVVDGVMLRPLPYANPGRLVSVWEGRTGAGPSSLSARGDAIGASTTALVRETVSPANLVDYRRDAQGFSGLAGFARAGRNLTGRGTPDRLFGEEVTWNYFDVLGVPPALGRAFGPKDDEPGAPPRAILSDALWRERFGADPGVIGQTVALDATPHTIVGVMPAGFAALTGFGRTETTSFWVPARYPADLLANHGDHEINVVGRLAPGASIERVSAELAATSARLARDFPDSNTAIRGMATPLSDDLVSSLRTSLVILLVAVGIVLVVACVNVANLLVVRSVSRRREIAVRLALGATRGRVARELVVQSLVLSTLAAVAGLAVAEVTKGLLVRAAPSTIPRLDAIALDWRTLSFTGAAALVTGLVFGVLPAWQAARTQPFDALGAGARVVAGTWVIRWRGLLIAVEMALSTVLLVGAGLMLRSLTTLNGIELGFRTDRVLALNVNLPETKYATGDARYAFFADLEPRLARLPGIQSVGVANRFPLRGGWDSGIEIDGVPAPGSFEASFQAVTPGYFPTLGIGLRQGRLLTDADRNGAEPAAVVSDAFGRAWLNGESPIGHRFRRGATQPWITIVGVVSDVRRDGQARRGDVRALPIRPQVYLPAAETRLYPTRLTDVALRIADGAAAESLVPAIRQAVLAIDPDQPVTNVRMLDAILVERGDERRFEALLFAVFAGLALVLALVGLAGVVSYAVAQRTPEIGLRMALGAGRGRILAWVLRQSLGVVAGGAAIGLGAALLLSRFISSLLFEVAPTDPLTYVTAAAALAVCAIAASALAARAATTVDPVVALRQD